MKRFLAILLVFVMLFTLSACGTDSEQEENPQPTEDPQPAEEAQNPSEDVQSTESEATEVYEDYDVRAYASQWEYYETCFVGNNPNKYVDMPYYALENVVYCTNPVDETYQIMNIYVPAAYMTENGDGTVSMNAKGVFGVMGTDDSTIMYMADEAPIIFINTVSGYAAGSAAKISDAMQGKDAGYYYQFVEQGFVLVCVGARGRTSTDAEGNVNGTVPAGLVDMKAGVRWLKYNDEFLAGDSEKIVTVGVSAGGGLSTMLGTSGDSDLYNPYLEEIGALDASDSVWATVGYCPVTCLEFADGISQWEYGTKSDDDFTGALSRALYEHYVTYMKSLNFDLGNDGVSGTFYEGLLTAFEEAFNSYIANKNMNGAEFVADIDSSGSWMTWSESDGVRISSLQDYVDNYWASPMPINGLVPSFDSFEGTSMESGVFGGRHFSWMMLEVLEELSSTYPEAEEYATVYAADLEDGMGDLAKLYDPIPFIVEGGSSLAKHWRFNIGTEDSNITQAVAWTVYNALNNYADVDAQYNILYGIGHQTVEFSPYDLVAWIYETDLGAKPKFDNIKAVMNVPDSNGNNAGGTASESYDTVAGTYTLHETNSVGMEIDWTLTLNLDGTYVLSESGVMEKSYTGIYGVIDGIVSCGPINEDDGPRGEVFGDGYISVWSVNKAAGTCAHEDLGKYTTPAAPGASDGGSANVSGTYTLHETNSMGMEIDWTLTLNEDGSYMLSEAGVMEKTYTGAYGAVDGYVSCGPINEEDGPRGDAFGEGYISVWTVDAATGTCAHADLGRYTEPGASGGQSNSTSVVGTYKLHETNSMGMEIDWTLTLEEDGTYVLSESGVMEKSYTGAYGVVDGYVSCGPINEEDGPRGDAFGEGYISVWTVNAADGSCAHADLGRYQAP